MNKLVIASVVSGLTLAGAGVGLVNADTASVSSAAANKVHSHIARYTVRTERTNAMAQVLNTTPPQLEITLKSKTLPQVIKSDGLTKSTFRQKLKAQLSSDLSALGYSQAQINAAINHSGKHGKRHSRPKISASTKANNG